MRSRIALAAALLAMTPAFAEGGSDRPYGAPHPEVIYPDELLPLPEGFAITRSFTRDVQQEPRTAPDVGAINLPREVPERLTACWVPPPLPAGGEAQVTVRLSFTAAGAVIGTPATPYLQAHSNETRSALRTSLLDAIRACTPLRFTASLGKAIAGRPFAIRFIVHAATGDRRI